MAAKMDFGSSAPDRKRFLSGALFVFYFIFFSFFETMVH